MSLQKYESLAQAFGPDGNAASNLLARVEHDLAVQPISLSAEHDADASRPPFLTHAIVEWYSHFVQYRTNAIAEIQAAFASITLGRLGQGFLAELERDAIIKRRNSEIRMERHQFFQMEEVQSLGAKIEVKREQYDRMRITAGGRDPEEWNRVFYVGLLTLIAIPEAVLNFRTFANMQIAFMTDAIALALTIIIAVVIAFASDVVGETFKQWRELFGGHAAETNKGAAARKFAWAWAAFLLAIGIVSGARYTLFAAEIQRKLVTGETLGFQDFLPFTITGGGNVLVFVFGVFIAIAAHDRIPGYGRTARELASLEARLARLYKRVLERRVQHHQSVAQNELANLEQREKMQSRSGHDYAANRQLFERLPPLRALSQSIDLSRGVPRIVILSPFTVEPATIKDTRTAREAGFAVGADAGLDLRRAEIVALGFSGNPGQHLQSHVEAFFLRSKGQLVGWRSDGLPQLPDAPGAVRIFGGTADYGDISAPIQIRIATDAQGNLVNSWVEVTAGRSLASPISGKAICRSKDACEVKGDGRLLGQAWNPEPKERPIFDERFAWSGMRYFEMSFNGTTGRVKISDPLVAGINLPAPGGGTRRIEAWVFDVRRTDEQQF